MPFARTIQVSVACWARSRPIGNGLAAIAYRGIQPEMRHRDESDETLQTGCGLAFFCVVSPDADGATEGEVCRRAWERWQPEGDEAVGEDGEDREAGVDAERDEGADIPASTPPSPPGRGSELASVPTK